MSGGKTAKSRQGREVFVDASQKQKGGFWYAEGKKWKIAGQGILLAARELRFWVAFALVFLIFGTLLNLLNSGAAGVNLMFSGGAEIFWRVLGKAFLAIFGVGREFSDFLLTFLILVLQSTLIATVTVVAKHAKDDLKISREEAEQIRGGAQNSGLVAGLAILGSGCPTCGTALITPILGMIFSTGGYAIAGVVSGVITLLAIIVAVFSLRAAGIDAYAGILKVCPVVARRGRGKSVGSKSTNASEVKKTEGEQWRKPVKF